MNKWIGKSVQVLRPEVLLRVGYPKAVPDYLDAVKDKWGDELDRLLGNLWRHGPAKSQEKIFRELAYMQGRADGFGGYQRTLHVLEHEALRGHVFEVVSRRRVWTGERDAGGGWGEDYEPPDLCNRQAHVVLGLHRPEKWQFEAADAVRELEARPEFKARIRTLAWSGEFEILLANVQLADADAVYLERAKAQEPPEDREWIPFP